MNGLLRWVSAAAALLLCSGCAGVPFEPTERVPLEHVDAEEARTRLASVTPAYSELLTSVVFEFWGHEITALGAVLADAETGRFALTCMTPVGVKLFDVSGTRQEAQCTVAIEGFIERFADEEQAADVIASGVRALYLDLVPPAGARVRRERTELTYVLGDEENRVEWSLAGRDTMLVEKRIYVAGDLHMRVRYFEHGFHAGQAVAYGAVLDDERFGYRLTVRVREVLE